MKNNFCPYVYFISRILIVVLVSLMALSCGKKPITNTSDFKDLDSLKREIAKLTKVNQAIKDSMAIKLPEIKTAKPECDSIARAEVDKAVEMLNRRVVSGNNQFNILYDKYNRLFNIYSEMGETVDQVTTDKTNNTKIQIRTVTKTIPEPYVPKFYLYSAYAGWAFVTYLIIRLIIKIKSWQLKKRLS